MLALDEAFEGIATAKANAEKNLQNSRDLCEELMQALFPEDISFSEADLRDHCAAIMAKHKIPRYIWFMDEALPRNASGKFLRRELRDQLSPAAVPA